MLHKLSSELSLFDRLNSLAPLKIGAVRLLLLFVLATVCVSPLAAQDQPAEAAGETEVIDTTATETVAEGEVVEEQVVMKTPSFMKRFWQGGWTMVFLLILSLIMGAFTVERFFNLRRSKVAPDGLDDKARAAWQTGDMNQVVAVAESQPSVLAEAIEVMARHPYLTANEISTLVGDEISRLMRGHLQMAYPLAIVATLAPLLGLLGTVIGMIQAFDVVAVAGSLGDASLLAAGISKALVTTAFGLIVAIPALFLYHFFRSRTHMLSLDAEEDADELIREWFHRRGEVTE